MKKRLLLLTIFTFLLSGCDQATSKEEGTQIHLSDEIITVDGKEISNDSSQAVYSANDIVFYLEGQDFTYGEGTKEDEHSQKEADAHTVVHITEPGKYVLSGELSLGQIAVDLGKDAKEDPEAVVTLILNGVDITCEVAPAVIFYDVYEPFHDVKEKEATKDVDTSEAGANILIADDTQNNIQGSYVAKIYKSCELNEAGTEIVDSKKLHKYDGAFYSKRTMNMNGGDKGNGILNIKAENEGLNSELHLTINGGVINITSGNDGINTNEDNISVTTINGGSLNVVCDGSTGEGDGIDSNGWLVINGGSLTSQACATSMDAGIDSDKGIFINGGKVAASGNMFDHIAGGEQTYAVFNFTSKQNDTYVLKNADGEVAFDYAPTNAFTYLIVAGDEIVPGDYTFWQGNTQLMASAVENMPSGMFQGKRPEKPEGETPEGELPEMPNGKGQKGERPEFPEGEMPEGELPNGMMPPDMMDGNMPVSGETSTTFTIEKGGNQFAYVSPMESE